MRYPPEGPHRRIGATRRAVLAAATWTIAVAVLVGGLVREGLGDLLFFAIIWGGPAFLLAALLGYALGRSGRRAVAVAVIYDALS